MEWCPQRLYDVLPKSVEKLALMEVMPERQRSLMLALMFEGLPERKDECAPILKANSLWNA